MIARLLTLFLTPAFAANSQYGILLMAHGGNADWNKEIATIGRALDVQAPTEVALGMADTEALQKAVDKLSRRHVAKIVAVPLFINSSSEVMDQTRYALGIGENPSAVLKEALAKVPHDMMPPGHQMAVSDERVETKLPIVLTPALDGHPAVVRVLLDRARKLSKTPAKETLFLVGHGPVDEAANADWLKTMAELAAEVKGKGGFRDAKVATIRDDSPPEVKAQAADDLRQAVERSADGGGRAIVIPYLIARGGIEDHIASLLKGLDFAWDGKTLCPHPAIVKWAAEVAREGSKRENMRAYYKGGEK